MSEKEKVMAVTLMRSDLYDAAGYAGAYLNLPASWDEIQDAMDRARISDGQPYKIVECFNSQGDELSFIPDDPSLAEMNFLARRVSEMNEHDRIAFTGCARMGNGNLGMRDLINQTYNLDDAHAVPAKNDRELGKFYVDNDFIDAVNHVPPAYQKELLELLDYEKIGCRQRESEGGIYHNGFYVVNGSGSWNPVYDGVHLPELPEEPAYVFKLQLAEASFTLDNPDPEHSVPLLLPASDEEILAALERLGAASLDECVFHHCDSPIPALEHTFSFSEDMGGRFKVRHLAVLIDRDDETGAVDEITVAPGAAIPGGAGGDQVVGGAFFEDDEIPLPQLRRPFCCLFFKGQDAEQPDLRAWRMIFEYTSFLLTIGRLKCMDFYPKSPPNQRGHYLFKFINL